MIASRSEQPVRVAEIMTARIFSCRTTDTLDRAAQLMWEHDCGALPIMDAHGDAVAMVTDRDICMAAYTQGKPLWQIPVTTAASQHLYCVGAEDTIEAAYALMKMHRVRRLPVVDTGHNVVGILSLADIVRHTRETTGDGLAPARVTAALADICRPHDQRRRD